LQFQRARPKRRVPQVLTHAEALAMIAVLHDPVRLAFELLYGCGLRQAECLNLRIKDIDFGMREIFVRSGKGGKDRVVPVHPLIRSALRAMPCRRSHGLIFGLTPRHVSHQIRRHLYDVGVAASAQH
jgi:integrase